VTRARRLGLLVRCGYARSEALFLLRHARRAAKRGVERDRLVAPRPLELRKAVRL